MPEANGGMPDMSSKPEGEPHLIQLFFLDLLDNLPRLRLSDDHLKAIIWA